MSEHIGKVLNVTRLRNKKLVTYFLNSQYSLACEKRDGTEDLKRSQIALVPVTLQFPEVLFNYELTERIGQVIKTIHHRHNHSVYLAENGCYVAYYFTYEDAVNGVSQYQELNKAKITPVVIKTQDYEAACHGKPTRILSDDEREVLYSKAMLHTLSDKNKKDMTIECNYKPEPYQKSSIGSLLISSLATIKRKIA